MAINWWNEEEEEEIAEDEYGYPAAPKYKESKSIWGPVDTKFIKSGIPMVSMGTGTKQEQQQYYYEKLVKNLVLQETPPEEDELGRQYYSKGAIDRVKLPDKYSIEELKEVIRKYNKEGQAATVTLADLRKPKKKDSTKEIPKLKTGDELSGKLFKSATEALKGNVEEKLGSAQYGRPWRTDLQLNPQEESYLNLEQNKNTFSPENISKWLQLRGRNKTNEEISDYMYKFFGGTEDTNNIKNTIPKLISRKTGEDIAQKRFEKAGVLYDDMDYVNIPTEEVGLFQHAAQLIPESVGRPGIDGEYTKTAGENFVIVDTPFYVYVKVPDEFKVDPKNASKLAPGESATEEEYKSKGEVGFIYRAIPVVGYTDENYLVQDLNGEVDPMPRSEAVTKVASTERDIAMRDLALRLQEHYKYLEEKQKEFENKDMVEKVERKALSVLPTVLFGRDPFYKKGESPAELSTGNRVVDFGAEALGFAGALRAGSFKFPGLKPTAVPNVLSKAGNLTEVGLLPEAAPSLLKPQTAEKLSLLGRVDKKAMGDFLLRNATRGAGEWGALGAYEAAVQGKPAEIPERAMEQAAMGVVGGPLFAGAGRLIGAGFKNLRGRVAPEPNVTERIVPSLTNRPLKAVSEAEARVTGKPAATATQEQQMARITNTANAAVKANEVLVQKRKLASGKELENIEGQIAHNNRVINEANRAIAELKTGNQPEMFEYNQNKNALSIMEKKTQHLEAKKDGKYNARIDANKEKISAYKEEVKGLQKNNRDGKNDKQISNVNKKIEKLENTNGALRAVIKNPVDPKEIKMGEQITDFKTKIARLKSRQEILESQLGVGTVTEPVPVVMPPKTDASIEQKATVVDKFIEQNRSVQEFYKSKNAPYDVKQEMDLLGKMADDIRNTPGDSDMKFTALQKIENRMLSLDAELKYGPKLQGPQPIAPSVASKQVSAIHEANRQAIESTKGAGVDTNINLAYDIVTKNKQAEWMAKQGSTSYDVVEEFNQINTLIDRIKSKTIPAREADAAKAIDVLNKRKQELAYVSPEQKLAGTPYKPGEEYPYRWYEQRGEPPPMVGKRDMSQPQESVWEPVAPPDSRQVTISPQNYEGYDAPYPLLKGKGPQDIATPVNAQGNVEFAPRPVETKFTLPDYAATPPSAAQSQGQATAPSTGFQTMDEGILWTPAKLRKEGFFARLYQNIFDDLATLRNIEMDIYKKEPDFAHSFSKHLQAMPGINYAIKMKIENEFAPIADSLRGKKMTFKDLNQYASAVHIKTIMANNKAGVSNIETGFDERAVNEAITKYKDILEPERKMLVDINRKMLTEQYKGGLISDKNYKLVQELYPEYVGLKRVGDIEKNGVVGLYDIEAPPPGKQFQARQLIKRLKGSKQMLMPATEATAENIAQTMMEVYRNKMAQIVGSWTQDPTKNALKYVRRIRDGEVFKGNNKMSYWNNGRRVEFEVSNDIHNAIQSSKAPQRLLLDSIIKAPGNLLRFGVTSNPAFLFSNAIADAMTAKINSPGFRFVDMPLTILDVATKGRFYEMMGKKSYYKRFMENYGGNSTELAFSPQGYESVLKDIEGGAKRMPAKAWKKFKSLAEISELTSRVNAFKGNVERRGMKDAEAAFEARDLLDFNRAGAWTRKWKGYVPFLNPALQGIDKTVRSISNPKTRANVIKQLAIMGVNTTLLYYGNRVLANEQQKEKIRNARPDVKNEHWLVSVPGTDEVMRIKKPFVYSSALNVIESGLDSMYQEDPKGFDQMAKEQLWNLLQNVPANFPMYSTGLKVMSNYDMWTEKPIVGTEMQGLALESQKHANTSWLGEQLAAGYRGLTGYEYMEGGASNFGSPIMMDYIVKSIAAGLGQETSRAVDYFQYLRGAKDPKLDPEWKVPFFNRFKLYNSAENNDMDKLYTLRDRMEVDKNTAREKGRKFDKDVEYNFLKSRGTLLGKFTQEAQNIYRDSNLSEAQKEAKLKTIIDTKNKLATDTMKEYRGGIEQPEILKWYQKEGGSYGSLPDSKLALSKYYDIELDPIEYYLYVNFAEQFVEDYLTKQAAKYENYSNEEKKFNEVDKKLKTAKQLAEKEFVKQNKMKFWGRKTKKVKGAYDREQLQQSQVNQSTGMYVEPEELEEDYGTETEDFGY